MAADSYIAFDEGTARKWDFWQRSISSNTVEQLRAVIAEPYLPPYGLVNTAAVLTTNANTHLMQMMGSTLNRSLIKRLRLYQAAAATTTTTVHLQLLRLTTPGTGGTSYTPNPFDPSDPATTVVGMTLPSANGAESVVLWQGSAILHAAADIANLESRCVLDVDWRDPQVKGPIIAAGTSNGLALKLLTACAVSTVVTDIEFTEAFWV